MFPCLQSTEAPLYFLGNQPSRIVSLVPSLTESIAAMGQANKLVGKTRFCVSSAEIVGHVPIVGGTKNPDIAAIKALAPDLVLMVKEENHLEDAQAICAFAPVLVFEVANLTDSLAMLSTLAQLLDALPVAEANWLRPAAKILAEPLPAHKPSVAYMIWNRPQMAAGGDTYISAMLAAAGFSNYYDAQPRYPQIKLATAAPDLIFLSTEPFSFSKKDVAAYKDKYKRPCHLVDGRLFSWYGTDVVNSLTYGRQLRATLGM